MPAVRPFDVRACEAGAGTGLRYRSLSSAMDSASDCNSAFASGALGLGLRHLFVQRSQPILLVVQLFRIANKQDALFSGAQATNGEVRCPAARAGRPARHGGTG